MSGTTRWVLCVVALLGMSTLVVPASTSVVADSGGALAGTPRARAGMLATGRAHSCVLTTAGSVVCWGRDSDGQLGNSGARPLDAAQTPARAANLPTPGRALALASGGEHTCALLTTGRVACWGVDSAGQVGNGAGESASVGVPTIVTLPGGTTATGIAAGSEHSCALLVDGRVSCWGKNAAGQLGSGATLPGASQPSPGSLVGLPPDDPATAIDAGGDTTCAVLSSGAVSCWGDDAHGQLGDGGGFPGTNQSTPRSVSLPAAAAAVAVGWQSACALLVDARVTCWGSDARGLLGDGGGSVSRSAPTTVVAMAVGDVPTGVSVGAAHACVVLASGGLRCWGDDTFGQLGRNSANATIGPTCPFGLTSFGNASCYGDLADPPPSSTTPAIVQTVGASAISVSVGFGHTCAVFTTGRVRCWAKAEMDRSGWVRHRHRSDLPPPMSRSAARRRWPSVEAMRVRS